MDETCDQTAALKDVSILAVLFHFILFFSFTTPKIDPHKRDYKEEKKAL